MNPQQDDDKDTGVVLSLLFAVLAAVLAFAIGVGIWKVRGHEAPAKVQAPAAAVVDADGASIKVENGVVKFYFASGKADVAPGAKEALADIVKAVAAGKKVKVSGFHDSTGDAAKNEELSKQRAFAVRDSLKAEGVGEDKIDLVKPQNSLATGSNAEARRVEVTIAD